MITSTSWQEGQSGNPMGRPPSGESITELIKTYLEQKPEGMSKTYKELFVEKLINMAVMKGNLNAMKLILSYADHDFLTNKENNDKCIPIPLLSSISTMQ